MGLADRTAPSVEEYEAYRDRFSNWGRWGDHDELGTLNHITVATRRAAAALAREGRSVSVGRPLATDPGPFNPNPVQHFMRVRAGGASDFIGISYHGYVNTHLDALCHIFTRDGRLYDGRPTSEITWQGALTCSVEHWRDGIVTRGVLYDIPRLRGVDYVTADAPVHGWELEDAAAAQQLEPQPGDAVLIRSGRESYFAANPDTPYAPSPAGVHASALEFLHQHDAALLCWDLLEAPDQGYPDDLPIHRTAIPYMGMPILDNANLERLAELCAELGRWEFQFVVAPLVLVGGTGSPVNPIAVL